MTNELLQVAYLTSLLEVTITNAVEQLGSIVVGADIEPSFLALGPFHLALGMNNRQESYVLHSLRTSESKIWWLNNKHPLKAGITDFEMDLKFESVYGSPIIL